MTAYYNENDPKAAAWLRELIKAKIIADGEVDERSIKDIKPFEVIGFDQYHFFAGIGGWSYALRLAGWPDDQPVWTGSCPCQPFSAAGKGEGTTDARHLWPEWFRLIKEHRPVAIFGEQVSAAIRHGWLDAVYADLEGLDYAVGAAVMGAHSVGAPHIRQRLYFVANTARDRLYQQPGGPGQATGAFRAGVDESDNGGRTSELADASRELIDRSGTTRPGRRGEPSDSGIVGNTEHGGREGWEPLGQRPSSTVPSGTSFWSVADWLPCIDGKARRVEPGTFPLAHGVPARVGRLRGYGNAIVPQVAQAFIEEYLKC